MAKMLCDAAAAGGHLALLQRPHQNGCGWDQGMCSGAAMRGPWQSCSGRDSTAAAGTRTNAPKQLDEKCCSGLARAAAAEIRAWAHAQPEGAIWQSYSGRDRCSHCSTARWTPSAAFAQPSSSQLQPYQIGRSWDESTCSGAALGGHLAVLQ